jgi:hypothetical protein
LATTTGDGRHPLMTVMRTGRRARFHPVGVTHRPVPSLLFAEESLDGGEQSGDLETGSDDV